MKENEIILKKLILLCHYHNFPLSVLHQNSKTKENRTPLTKKKSTTEKTKVNKN